MNMWHAIHSRGLKDRRDALFNDGASVRALQLTRRELLRIRMKPKGYEYIHGDDVRFQSATIDGRQTEAFRLACVRSTDYTTFEGIAARKQYGLGKLLV